MRPNIRDILIRIMQQFPEGASLLQINNSASKEVKVTSRTIQRWLHELIIEGTLKRLGKGRSITYHLVEVTPTSVHNPFDIPLSNNALDIASLVQQPTNQRVKIGYVREFLDSYKPNITYYLSEKELSELNQLGGELDEPLPAGIYARKILDRLLIDLSWNSSRLEGNTYSLLETKQLFELGELADNKSFLEAQMILNQTVGLGLSKPSNKNYSAFM